LEEKKRTKSFAKFVFPASIKDSSPIDTKIKKYIKENILILLQKPSHLKKDIEKT
jgi:hypothetical protein